MRHWWEPIGMLDHGAGVITTAQLGAASRLRKAAAARNAYIEMTNEGLRRDARVEQDEVAPAPATDPQPTARLAEPAENLTPVAYDWGTDRS